MPEKAPYERGSFISTRKSLVFAAAEGTDVTRRDALGELWRLYLPALRSYLVMRLRVDPERAEDLLQAFVTRQILERQLLSKFDASRGRFRSFLLKSLQNFVFDALRGEHADWQSDIDEPAAEPASDAFDLEWSRQLLGESLRRMRRTCIADGNAARWDLFQARVVVPTLTGCAEPSYKSLVVRFGFRTPEHACNALVTAKRQFERTLRDLISETEKLADPAEIDREIADLCAIARRAGPLDASWASDLLCAADSRSLPDFHADEENWAGEMASLLSIRPTREGNWRLQDHQELLGHFMAMSVDDYLHTSSLSVAEEEFTAEAPSQAFAMSQPLGDFLKSPNPPLGILITLKQHARCMFGPGLSDMPAEVHGVVYLATIAAARMHYSERISKLHDNVLRRSFDGLATDPNLDIALRNMFERALQLISVSATSG